MSHSAGGLLRDWRERRRLSQMELANEAEISTRHLSFVETGRSNPSREMILRLAERLDVPLRERNALLLAAGFAPAYSETPLTADALHAAKHAIELVLRGHEPYPAIAVDRHWNLVLANRTAVLFMEGADPSLLQPPVNVVRLSVHPLGLARRIANLSEWRHHLIERLRRQAESSADPVLFDLVREIRQYPVAPGDQKRQFRDYAGVVVPIELITDSGLLSFFSTSTIFGTPVDVTLAEIAIEAFFPANDATAEAVRALAAASATPDR